MQICATWPWSKVKITSTGSMCMHLTLLCHYLTFHVKLQPFFFSHFLQLISTNSQWQIIIIARLQDSKFLHSRTFPFPSYKHDPRQGCSTSSCVFHVFFHLQRVCPVEHLAETSKPWRLSACCIIFIASRGCIQYCSWKAAGIISFWRLWQMVLFFLQWDKAISKFQTGALTSLG